MKTIKLRTVTPLHIGSGEMLHSSDYIIDNQDLYHISNNIFNQFLTSLADDQTNIISQQYVDWVLEKSVQIDELEFSIKKNPRRYKDKNQDLSFLREEFNYDNFFKTKTSLHPKFIKFIQANCNAIRIEQPRQLKQQIRAQIRNGHQKLYMPGSSIKGVIRTALTHYVLSNHFTPNQSAITIERAFESLKIKEELARQKGRRINPKQQQVLFGQNLEHEIFYCAWINDRGKKRSHDEQYDLMKLVSVSDSIHTEQNAIIENTDLYLVAKKPSSKPHSGTVIEATQQSQSPAIEAIQEASEITTTLNFDIDFILELKENFDDLAHKKKQTHWIGWREKVTRLFNIDLEKLNRNNKEEYRSAVINHILFCLRTFSNEQIRNEKEWLKRFLEKDRNKFTRKINSGYQRIINNRNQLLINIGFASGFHATTIFLYLKRTHYDLLKKILEYFKIGEHPLAFRSRPPGTSYQANPNDFPKSRTLITRNDAILPIGWLEIIDPDNSSSTETGRKSDTIEPELPKGKIKPGSIIDAKIIKIGKPNTIKLYLSETEQPELFLRYGNGFKSEQLGQIIQVSIKDINRKTKQIIAVEFKNIKR